MGFIILSNWGQSVIPSAVPLLSQETADYISELQKEIASLKESMVPRIILPDCFHAVAGDTLQLFYRGMIEAPDPYVFCIDVQCDIGKSTSRYFEITPTEDQKGVHDMTIRIRDFRGNILNSGKTKILVHVPQKAPHEQKNILCVGDSLTSFGFWPNETLRRFTKTDGAPNGLGLDNISFVGTVRKGNCSYEGYGGWSWIHYLKEPQTSTLGMWCYGSRDKNEQDSHSLWKDSNGNIWSLETIEENRIKFTRFNDHDGEMPTGNGVLKHYENASHKADITFSETAYANGNPFWNPLTEKVDFQNYCKLNGFSKIDYLVTLLSWNGAAGHGESAIKKQTDYAREFFRIFHKDYPDAKVKMLGINIPSVNGGTGENYGANRFYPTGITLFFLLWD